MIQVIYFDTTTCNTKRITIKFKYKNRLNWNVLNGLIVYENPYSMSKVKLDCPE